MNRNSGPTSPEAYEEQFIKSFVKKDKQKRLMAFAKDSKNRKKFTSGLAHTKDIEPQCIHRIPADSHTAEKIEAILKRNGASDECYVISEHTKFDRKQSDLLSVLTEVIGTGLCTVVCCIPGKLAYYEGEESGERYLLVNRMFT